MITAAYVLTCVVMVVAPGPGFAVVVHQAVTQGRPAGLATVLGNTTGLVFWATASLFGLTALIRASAVAFLVLKLAGAAYLAWLGVRALLRARRPAAAPDAAGAPGLWASYRSGLLTNVTNPKAAVLYLALLPQFLPAHGNPAVDTATLAGVQMAISVTWYSSVVLAVGLARRTLSRPRVKAWVDRVSGVVLVGLGVRMLSLGRAAV